MNLTRVQTQRIIDKIDTQSDFPWKHELMYLRETVDALFDEVDRMKSTDTGWRGDVYND